MIKKKKGGKGKRQVRDPEKERIFKRLSQLLHNYGYTVRREKLKQGFGWKVVSGSCVVETRKLVFVDSRMSQEDQVTFLLTVIRRAKLAVESKDTEGLPPSLVEQLLDSDSPELAGTDISTSDQVGNGNEAAL
jgi:hypothetical protein